MNAINDKDQKNEKRENALFLLSGLSVFLASLCCIGPALLGVLGLGALVSSLGFLVTLKPLFLAIAIGSLLLIWVLKGYDYFKSCRIKKLPKN